MTYLIDPSKVRLKLKMDYDINSKQMSQIVQTNNPSKKIQTCIEHTQIHVHIVEYLSCPMPAKVHNLSMKACIVLLTHKIIAVLCVQRYTHWLRLDGAWQLSSPRHTPCLCIFKVSVLKVNTAHLKQKEKKSPESFFYRPNHFNSLSVKLASIL